MKGEGRGTNGERMGKRENGEEGEEGEWRREMRKEERGTRKDERRKNISGQ